MKEMEKRILKASLELLKDKDISEWAEEIFANKFFCISFIKMMAQLSSDEKVFILPSDERAILEDPELLKLTLYTHLKTAFRTAYDLDTTS